MCNNYSRVLLVAIIMWTLLWLGAGLIVGLSKAQAQPNNEPVGRDSRDSGPHERYHDFYKSWTQPGGLGISCCNANEYLDGAAKMQHMSGDCEPTEAELRRGPDGKPEWWARLPKYLGGEFIPIPNDKVIREINPEPNSAHLCYNYGKVLCFVPPFGGF